MADIAQKSGLSRATVSYVLNNTSGKAISRETRDKILKVASELKYTPNYFARGLKTERSMSIAIMAQELTDPTIMVTINGINMQSNKYNYTQFIQATKGLGLSRKEVIERLCSRSIDGLIYMYPDKEKDMEMIKEIVEDKSIPTVLVGRKFKRIKVDCVRFDYYQAGYEMAKHLCELGHRTIAYVVTGEMTSGKKMRLDGINDCMNEYGVSCDILQENALYDNKSYFELEQYEGTQNLIEGYIKTGINHTALIGSNAIITASILNVFKKNGIDVPKDISVACFGENIVLNIENSNVTFIPYPYYEIGEVAFKLLFDRMENKGEDMVKDIIYSIKLVLGETTAAPTQKNKIKQRCK